MGPKPPHAFQVVPVGGEKLVGQQPGEAIIGYFHDLQVEEEKLAAHEIAELGSSLGEPLVIVGLRVGGKEEVGVQLGFGQKLAEVLVATHRLCHLSRIKGCHLSGVAFTERPGLRSAAGQVPVYVFTGCGCVEGRRIPEQGIQICCHWYPRAKKWERIRRSHSWLPQGEEKSIELLDELDDVLRLLAW